MNEPSKQHDEVWTEPEDRALYEVLGRADEVAPSADFQARVLAAARPEAQSARVFPWRPWSLVAAAVLVGLTVFLMDDEKPKLVPDTAGELRLAQSKEVYESMNELSELDLLALEVEELGSIHDDWFGG